MVKGQGTGSRGKALPEKAEKALPPDRHSGVVMFSLFQRKWVPPATGAPAVPSAAVSKGLLRPESAASLLGTPRRRRLLEHIWQRTSVSRAQFAMLYQRPLERYAELVQQFPASESHHHAYPGGMLDHGLEITAYALKLRQSHLLPVGAPPESQAAQAEAWTAGAAYAALLHDVGKVAVDLYVELADGSAWHPWHGPLPRPYRFRYRQDREYRLHSAATGLLCRQVLDVRILDWLSGYPALWASLLYVLAGQYEHAGVLGELVVQADRASVAQELGGDPAKAMAAPKHALQRKLLEGLRYLLREELKLNQPQASDGWLTQDALWLVSKTVSDKLRAHLLAQGIDGVPANNTAVFNVLQDHGIAQPTADGKAIWKAAVTSNTGWSRSFTFLKLAPSLFWESGERPTPFAGSVLVKQDDTAEPDHVGEDEGVVDGGTTDALPLATATTKATADGVDALLGLLDTTFNTIDVKVPPAPDFEPPATHAEKTGTADDVPTTAGEGEVSGEHFIAWLTRGIQSRKLIINDSKALVHTVSDTAYLVSPGIFQRYAQEHTRVAILARNEKVTDWQWVQRRFERLHLHRKHDSGLNIWTCEVSGPRKSRRLHGYLLQDPRRLFTDLPPNNPYLSLVDSA